MSRTVAINGFGRIGRAFLRSVLLDKNASSNITIAAINEGPCPASNLDLLFKYDSVMREFPGEVSVNDGHLIIGKHKIKLFSAACPTELPWQSLGIDWVVEASGCFTSHEAAMKHVQAGAQKVLITAPSKNADITVVPGINDGIYQSDKHRIVSLGSCTTNCFAPLVKVISEQFGIVSGQMTTIHAYTNNQHLLDNAHKDPRRARSASLNMIPTKTGASKVITQLFPELDGKLSAIAIRVPVPNISLVDFAFVPEKTISKDLINKAFENYAQNQLKDILHYSAKPLVSSDYIGNSHSSIFDSLLTQCSPNLGKVFAWYDNEFGYSCRLRDFLLHNA